MMVLLLRLASVIARLVALGLAIVAVPAEAEISGFGGGDARVVVLDASGSMQSKSFKGASTARFDIARQVLSEVFAQLYDKGDTTPTAFTVFGAQSSWSASSAQFGGKPSNVPVDHPLCHDITTLQNFSLLDRSSQGLIDDIASGLQPNGMTPIHLSLLEGLKAFQGNINNAKLQFILISDLEDPNCLPAGDDICDSLKFELDRIKSAGGRVEAVVFETPRAKIREPLSKCMPVTTFPLSSDNPDPSGSVAASVQSPHLTPRVVLAPGNLDPNGVVAGSARFEIIRADTNAVVASGPQGDFELPAGQYLVSAALDDQSAQVAVKLDQDVDAAVTLPAAELAVQVTVSGAPSSDLLSRILVARPGGIPVAEVPDFRPGDVLQLANGAYEITGYDASGQPSLPATVVLALGHHQDLTIDFGAPAPSARNVIFVVHMIPPTLSVVQNWDPQLHLVLPSGAQKVIDGSGSSMTLEPGTYHVLVASSPAAPAEDLSLDVQPGAAPLDVRLRVVPGWLKAESLSEGHFELATGPTALYSFDGNEVLHSLPDGHYDLTFEDKDGSKSTRSFDIHLGQEAFVQFP